MIEHLAEAVPSVQSTSVCPGDEAARQLTRGVARGQPQAVAAFYEQWFDFTLRQARRASGRDESFALDIVQEVMIKCARSLPELESRAAIERWLTRVVCNAAVDHLRAERRRRRRETMADPSQSMTSDADATEWVHAQLGRLNAEEAMLVRLRYAGAMKLRDVGEAVNLSAEAVRGRLRGAMAALRRHAEEGEQDGR